MSTLFFQKISFASKNQKNTKRERREREVFRRYETTGKSPANEMTKEETFVVEEEHFLRNDEEEEEILRRDVDKLLAEIESLKNDSSLLIDDESLARKLGQIERERARISEAMVKARDEKDGKEDDDEAHFLLSRFNVVRGASSSVAEYVDSAIRNVYSETLNIIRNRERNILRELDAFVDRDESSIETNTIRLAQIDREGDARREWIRRFGIQPMIGTDEEEEKARAERSLRALESSGASSGRNVANGGERSNKQQGKGTEMLFADEFRAKEEEDLEKAIEKNVLSSVDSAIKSLESASLAIAKANKNSKETGSSAATSFATVISNFSGLPVWQKRVIGLLVFFVFSWILILNAMNNDEKSEFEEIDQSIASTADVSSSSSSSSSS